MKRELLNDEDLIVLPDPRRNPAGSRPRAEYFGLDNLMNDNSIAIPTLAIEGLLPRTGLLLLGGRPKDGKSWFACQIALSIATGEALGGWLKVTRSGRVHLYALEDQYAITKDKMSKLLRAARPEGLKNINVFANLAQPILNGGDQIIRDTLAEMPADLMILDSLFKLAGAKQPNSDLCQRDYDVIDRVRRIALDHKCAAIIVMHTKKSAPGGNPIENLLGTSGIPAAADAIAELKRYRAGSGKLSVVGRSVPSEDYELIWHGGPDEWGWSIQDTCDQISSGETSEEVLAYLDAQGSAKPTEIATALRKSFQSIWHALLRLEEKGRVRRDGKKWELSK